MLSLLFRNIPQVQDFYFSIIFLYTTLFQPFTSLTPQVIQRADNISSVLTQLSSTPPSPSNFICLSIQGGPIFKQSQNQAQGQIKCQQHCH